MLIYVNNFKLDVDNATERALQSVCGWIKYKTHNSFTTDMLKSSGNFKFDNITIRTFCALSITPYMYSILVTHPDKEINGRYWETEIGITEDTGITKISLMLKVNDISTQVRGDTTTTRPLLVKYLYDSKLLAKDTIGLKASLLKNELSDIKALKFEIYRPERDHPLVLVSHNPLINVQKLQQQLIGLARVVGLPTDMDDGLLESELGQRYSAWDGAINIINPLHGGETPRNTLILSDIIKQWNTNGINVLHEILSLVTHSTNGKHRKEHFSPTDVRAKRQKDHRIFLIQKVSSLTESSDYKVLLEEAMAELDALQEATNSEIEDLRGNLTDSESMYYEAESNKASLENKIIALDAQISSLEYRLENRPTNSSALFKGNENELYFGEISDILLDAVITAFDSSTQYSRRKDILKDIIEKNPKTNIKTKTLDALKVELKNYRSLSPKLREILNNINIEVLTDGTHNKAKFKDDERYTVTFAKTASDTNAGRNIFTFIKDNLF